MCDCSPRAPLAYEYELLDIAGAGPRVLASSPEGFGEALIRARLPVLPNCVRLNSSAPEELCLVSSLIDRKHRARMVKDSESYVIPGVIKARFRPPFLLVWLDSRWSA